MALPISSCGLKLDDEAVTVTVSLRLGLDLRVHTSVVKEYAYKSMSAFFMALFVSKPGQSSTPSYVK